MSGATFIMSVVGFCWAITQWAPFALVSEDRARDHPVLTPYPNGIFSLGRQYYPTQPQMMRGQSISLTRVRHAWSIHAMKRKSSSFFKPTSTTTKRKRASRTITPIPAPIFRVIHPYQGPRRLTKTMSSILVRGSLGWEIRGHASAGSTQPFLLWLSWNEMR